MTTLIEQLAAVRPETAGRQVTERSRLTGDLGLDSVELAELFERIREVYGEVEIADWLAMASRAEGDTVGSLVRYLSTVLPEQLPRPLVAGSAR
ncbi:hypothetical protein ABZT17_33405 [Streptomyces sp. NPDC005648]|uniref:acyl carrier protein n=1 Tax=Streptomyces sp. NPDC005648 TaxID=3157044 RepID=UPI0033B2C366